MRLPPALAAAATPRILELLEPPPGRVLELGFAGIHAVPLRLAGFDVARDVGRVTRGQYLTGWRTAAMRLNLGTGSPGLE